MERRSAVVAWLGLGLAAGCLPPDGGEGAGGRSTSSGGSSSSSGASGYISSSIGPNQS